MDSSTPTNDHSPQARTKAVADGSKLRLRHPGSGQLPGRIQGGHQPLRRSTTASVSNPKKNKNTPTGCTNQSHESQHSVVTATSLSESQASESVHEPAAEDVEGDNVPVEISDEDEGEDEQEEVEVVGSKRRKLTSPVWRHFERVKIKGNWKAKCAYCKKKLGGETKYGTKHLHDHLRKCYKFLVLS